MKKFCVQFALVCALMTALCTIAFADTETGIRNVTVESAYQSYVTLTPQTASGANVTASGGYYPNAEKVQAVITGAETDRQVLIFAQTDEKAPTEDNLVYIDQKTSAAELTFTVYPKELTAGTTYYIYLVSNASSGTVQSLSKVGSFVYYSRDTSNPGGEQPGPGTTDIAMGDVNKSELIDAEDAMDVLRHVAKIIDLADTLGDDLMTVADVNGSKLIDAEDAMDILRHVAKIIDLANR